MADGILIPPWLHGVSAGEIGRLHAEGLRMGQQAAAQQMQTMLEFQQMQQKQAEAQARQAQAQQEIELEVQKQQQAAAQAQAELQFKREQDRREAATAAMRFAGAQIYDQTYKDLVTQGVDPEEAKAQAMLRAGLTVAPSALFSARAMSPEDMTALGETAEVEDPTTGRRLGVTVRTGPRSAVFRPETPLTITDKMEMNRLYKRIAEREKQIAAQESTLSVLDPKRPAYQRAKTQTDELRKKIEADEEAIRELSGKTVKAPRSSTGNKQKDRVALANELAEAHPDWGREKIIAEVKRLIP